jgi:hypothetical protein
LFPIVACNQTQLDVQDLSGFPKSIALTPPDGRESLHDLIPDIMITNGLGKS